MKISKRSNLLTINKLVGGVIINKYSIVVNCKWSTLFSTTVLTDTISSAIRKIVISIQSIRTLVVGPGCVSINSLWHRTRPTTTTPSLLQSHKHWLIVNNCSAIILRRSTTTNTHTHSTQTNRNAHTSHMTLRVIPIICIIYRSLNCVRSMCIYGGGWSIVDDGFASTARPTSAKALLVIRALQFIGPVSRRCAMSSYHTHTHTFSHILMSGISAETIFVQSVHAYVPFENT